MQKLKWASHLFHYAPYNPMHSLNGGITFIMLSTMLQYNLSLNGASHLLCLAHAPLQKLKGTSVFS